KPLRKLLGIAVVALGVAGCGDGGGEDRDAAAPGDDTAARRPVIAVIPKGTIHEFWRSIEAGARKAERELREAGTPVEVIWKGPLREDDRDQQIQVVENFTARRVSGIVLAPLDSQALVNPVENAVAAGIPVVI